MRRSCQQQSISLKCEPALEPVALGSAFFHIDACISFQSEIEPPCSGPCLVLALAGIQRRVERIKAIKKYDLNSLSGLEVYTVTGDLQSFTIVYRYAFVASLGRSGGCSIQPENLIKFTMPWLPPTPNRSTNGPELFQKYRGTSLIRKHTPHGLYSMPGPRALR